MQLPELVAVIDAVGGQLPLWHDARSSRLQMGLQPGENCANPQPQRYTRIRSYLSFQAGRDDTGGQDSEQERLLLQWAIQQVMSVLPARSFWTRPAMKLPGSPASNFSTFRSQSRFTEGTISMAYSFRYHSCLLVNVSGNRFYYFRIT
jgi:hypothetical protein